MLTDGWSGPPDAMRTLPGRIDEMVQRFGSDIGHYYAIGEEAAMLRRRSLELITLDCISVSHFWSTLQQHRDTFQVLENYHNAAASEEVANRIALLDDLLDVDAVAEVIGIRCAVLLFCRPDEREYVLGGFAAAEWRRIGGIFPQSRVPIQLSVTRRTRPGETFAVRNIHDDAAIRVPRPWAERLDTVERLFLEEIFSFNHVRDEPIEGNETPLEPSPNVPLILSDGGFAIDGDAEFWREERSGVLYVTDDKISPYPRKGRAFCRATKREYVVVGGDEKAPDGEYEITLRSCDSGRDYVIGIDGERLTVTDVSRNKDPEPEPQPPIEPENPRFIYHEPMYMGHGH
ncbi:MAG TPA: hypothetical protein VJZ00_17090 [Thermoanaerobaculia bacterium]|nr:hypothetical protein [Thermoanaerobaculia bacterium]